MAQPRHIQQRPISKEEKLAWIYSSDLHTRTNPSDKSQQASGMNRQTITEMGAGSGSSAPAPCNIAPPVVSSSQSDRDFHTRSMMNLGSSSQAQPTSSQQSPTQPLGDSQGPTKTRDKSNPQKYSEELVLEDFKIPVAQPEIDPLGSEHVRIAACKEVRRRELEKKNARLDQFMEQAGSGQGPEVTSRESEITRLEALLDEQMKDVMGAVDRIESEARFRLWGQQYGGNMSLGGPNQEPASESSQISPSMQGPSTCYYWDKYQKDSTQPPCQLGLACRFPHSYIGGGPVASAQHDPEANPRRSLSPASNIRRHRQVMEDRHVPPNDPSFNPLFQINHAISRRPIDKTSMKYSPPPRPSGPSPLGSTQRSMAELRVPQLSLPLRPKVRSTPPGFQDTGFNTVGQNSLENFAGESFDLGPLSKESYVKREDHSDPFSTSSSTRRYSSSLLSQGLRKAQQMSDWSNSSMYMELKPRGRRGIATTQTLRGEEQYHQCSDDNQPSFKAPVKKSYQGTLRFAREPYGPLFSTSSPKYQAKKLEREFRESEERGEKEIIERARAGSVGTIDRPEPEDHFKTASMNALNAAEVERRLAHGRRRKHELRDTSKGPLYVKDMRDDGASKRTLSSGNVFERPATTVEQPRLNNKPLVIRNRPSNPPKQETAPGTSAPKAKQLKDKSLTFQQPRPISGPLRGRQIPANVEWQELFQPLPINPLAPINLGSKAEKPKRESLNVPVTQRPNLGLEREKWTTAELIQRHKLAMQNSEAKRERLHSAGVMGTLNGAVGENIQTVLRQPEAKEPALKPGNADADTHFSDVELAEVEKASSGANREEGEDWIVVEDAV
jgi:hypothetical protein